ncbi:MAG: ZIP family metal transporter, partial [Candidatus Neomarinimicrobiota bacterium]
MSLAEVGLLLGLVLAAFVGALPPLLGRWSDRQLHLFVAFGAGVFLGAVFFHLVPEAMAHQPNLLTNAMILIGFMAVLLVERVLVVSRQVAGEMPGEQRHHIVGISAFVGLSLHSLAGGFVLGAGLIAPKLALVLFLVVLSHKPVEGFTLATVFRLSELPLRRSLVLLAIFAACTPVGVLLAVAVLNSLEGTYTAIPAALAAGTFIYVATMDLLPEAFHNQQNRL